MGNIKSGYDLSLIEKYAEEGVLALATATPLDSGETANSWFYKISKTKNKIILSFHNDNVKNGLPIAIILHYGHATRDGGWVEGSGYINTALTPIFEELSQKGWKELISK